MILNKPKQEFTCEGQTFYIGQKIVATEASPYDGLLGTIREIRDGDDTDNDNETADIYCYFEPPQMPYDIEQLEEKFSRLYGKKMTIDDICLDCVIMASEMLEPLDNQLATEKVFVVIEDWAHDDNYGVNHVITTSMREAKKQMRIMLNDELKHGCLSEQLGDEDFIVESSELCYEAYQDGYADAEHYMLSIRERNFCFDNEFAEKVMKSISDNES